MTDGNPQVEDGFTRLANELFDAVLRAPFTLAQQKVLLAVVRLTYGYNRREDAISFGQVARATGLERRSVIRAMTQLLTADVLTRKPVGAGHASVWGVQKRYQLWCVTGDPPVTTSTSDSSVTGDLSGTTSGDTSVTTTSDSPVTHQRQKDNKDRGKESARPDRRPPTHIPSAVTVYREVTHLNPQKSWYGRLAETVGEDPADLERWREVCMRWIGLGWKKTNVAVMLDYFVRGELPGAGRGNGRDSPRASPGTPYVASRPLERKVADLPKGWLQEPFDPDEEPQL